MTRFYFDTEFSANAWRINGLSIGIVTDAGDKYYGVIDRSQWGRNDWMSCLATADDPQWLRTNVYANLPIFETGSGRWLIDPGHPDARTVKPQHVIRDEVHNFINGRGRDGIELWANFARYDGIVIAKLFGGMRDWPANWPYVICDVQQEAARLGNPTLPEQLAGQHHALADAHHTRRIHEFLRLLFLREPEHRAGGVHL